MIDSATAIPYGRTRGAMRLSPIVLSGFMAMLEGALTLATGLIMYSFYLGDPAGEDFQRYTLAILLTTQIQLVGFAGTRLYRLDSFRRPLRLAARIFVTWTAVFIALMVLAFLTKMGADFSRVWLAGWFASGFAAIMVSRAAVSIVVRHWTRAGRLERRVVIIGADERGAKLIDALNASSDSDIRIIGIFDDRTDRAQNCVPGYPVLGSVKALVDFGRRERIDLLILTLPFAAESRILQMVKQLYVLPVDIRLSAHTNALRFAPHSYSYIGEVPMLDVCNRPVADWGHVLKTLEDRILAAAFLVLAMPVFAIIAALIKLDSKGPVFFKQKRYGFNNELIEVYKFRTLRVEMTDPNAERLVTANDPRVTNIGKILRRTSLDELPQLFSVFKGGMSIVGPRPHATAAKAGTRLYQEVVDGYYARHRVKPGITGWAQINGWRGETDTEEKIMRRTEHDLYYIDNWSIWLDLYIVAKTPIALLKGHNAY